MLRTLLTAAAVAAALGVAGWHALTGMEARIMANFDALNAKLDEQATALNDAKTRIADDFAALTAQIAALELDGDDQAKVDEATAKVQASIDTLTAIDPVASVPADGSDTAPVAEPEQPTA